MHSDERAAVASPNLRVSPKLLRDEVGDRLREAIIQGYYKPGARLIERDLCDAMGVSRTSVREALRQLEAELLVTVEPRPRGPLVARISPTQAGEIYELRKILETAAACLFVERATQAQRSALRQNYRDFARAVKEGDEPAMIASMRLFYDTLFSGTQNEALHSISAQLMARISYLRARSMSEPGRPKHSVKEIGAVVSAIESGDLKKVEKAVVDHIVNAADAAKRQLRKYEQFSQLD